MNTYTKFPVKLSSVLLPVVMMLTTLVISQYTKDSGPLIVTKELAIQILGTSVTLIVCLGVWVFSLEYSGYKIKKEYRRKKIQEWRTAIGDISSDTDFRKSVVCSEVFPHLSKATHDVLRSNAIHVYVGSYSGHSVLINSVLNDITKLEKKWDLI